MNKDNMNQQSTNIVYITILIQSLEQKNLVLDELLKQTIIQEKLLKDKMIENDRFNAAIDEKDKLLKKLQKLDEGFQQLYDKVAIELKENTQKFAPQITQMKQLISLITQKSANIETIERRNKTTMEILLNSEYKRIRDYRINSQTAANYYKSMSKITGNETFFVDKKS